MHRQITMEQLFYLICVRFVKDVIVDDGVKDEARERVLCVSVGCVFCVKPLIEFVEEILDAVDHVLTHGCVRRS